MPTETSTDTELENERPLRADARRNRERIIHAARELFAGEQPNVQMDEVAHRAGVGVGTVYRHFPDKEALMGELVRERFVLFNADLRHALADEHSGAFETLAGALRSNVVSIADDAATRFAFMSGGERVFAHAASRWSMSSNAPRRRARPARPPRRRAARGLPRERHPDGHVRRLRDDRVSKPGWDWQRHLTLILHGMHA